MVIKKTINGKKYNTATAVFVKEIQIDNENYKIFKKTTGEYFHVTADHKNCGFKITPILKADWDKFEIFENPEEEKTMMSLWLNSELFLKIKLECKRLSMSQTGFIQHCIKNYFDVCELEEVIKHLGGMERKMYQKSGYIDSDMISPKKGNSSQNTLENWGKIINGEYGKEVE